MLHRSWVVGRPLPSEGAEGPGGGAGRDPPKVRASRRASRAGPVGSQPGRTGAP